MQPAQRFLSAVALTLLSASSFATTTVYTSSATFLPQVAAGSYSNSFTGLANPAGSGAVPFSGGAFAYSASAPSGIYLEGGFLGANQISEALTITFTGTNVRAVGANFFMTDFSDAFQSVSVTITLNDGTIHTFTPTSLTDSYRGFASTTPITSLIISAPGPSLYAGLDNLTVGAVVPEPASWLLMGLGLTGLLVAARRRSI